MPSKIEPHKTIEKAEVVRGARETAWMLCLLLVLSPTSYIIFAANPIETMSLTEMGLLVLLPSLVFVRSMMVAVRLGQNLIDHTFMTNENIRGGTLYYFVTRFFGS